MKKENYINDSLSAITRSLLISFLPFGSVALILLGLLDYFVTPANFSKFLIYRLIAATVGFSLFIFFKYKKNVSNLSLSIGIVITAMIPASMVEVMIFSLGGHQSVYYAGMIITLIFILGFLPISFKMSALVACLIYAAYLVPILLFDEITNPRIFINNNMFLLACAAGALGWRYFYQRLLVKNLSLEYDLSQDKKQLEIYSLQLQELVEERTKDLRKSEQWHRSLVDNATDGIIVLDRNGIIVNINDRACEMHGFSKDVLVGTHVRLLEGADSSGVLNERIHRLLAGESLVFESMHLRRDGTPLYLEISSKAIKIEDDIFIQSFYRDITEKKRIQEHLFQSQKMDSIGVLAGGIAHDFNNILTAIIGHSEIIRRSALDEKAGRSLNVIEEAARRAGRMISKLLGFARKSNFEIVPLNLNDIIFDTVKLLERVIDKRINLTVELDNRLPLIQGDVNQMEQVIMNLIVNARDAMTNGGRIVIKTTERVVEKGMADVPAYVPPDHYVLLSVSDTGTGIPRDIINKIFEPFFTTKERGRGTGLGLSMVYGVVKEHKGYIAVQSEQGKGTAFSIYIPASRAVAKAEEKQQMPSVSGNETVLVVDDEPDILHAVQDALTTHGYKVFAVSDPAAAISIFNKLSKEIALVITDIVMPKLNGKELISRIKTVNPDVKILAVSGYTKYIAPKDEIGEINGFLQKPFESYYLLSVVRRILDAQSREMLRN